MSSRRNKKTFLKKERNDFRLHKFLFLFSLPSGFKNLWLFFRVELCSLNGLFYEENEAHPLLFPFALRVLCFYVFERVSATLAHWVKPRLDDQYVTLPSPFPFSPSLLQSFSFPPCFFPQSGC